jgi:hypothetical protein
MMFFAKYLVDFPSIVIISLSSFVLDTFGILYSTPCFHSWRNWCMIDMLYIISLLSGVCFYDFSRDWEFRTIWGKDYL